MAVISSTFGAVRLTKRDAEKFMNQVTYGRPKQAAKDACARGEKSAAEFVEKGYAILKKRA